MKHFSLLTALLVASAPLAAGCETTIGGDGAEAAGNASGSSGASGSGTGGNSTGGSTGTGGMSGASGSGKGGSAGTPTGCEGSDVTTPKRLVRLLDWQLVNSYITLFGSTAVPTIAQGIILESLIARPFPPLNGEVNIDQSQYSIADRLAQEPLRT